MPTYPNKNQQPAVYGTTKVAQRPTINPSPAPVTAIAPKANLSGRMPIQENVRGDSTPTGGAGAWTAGGVDPLERLRQSADAGGFTQEGANGNLVKRERLSALDEVKITKDLNPIVNVVPLSSSGAGTGQSFDATGLAKRDVLSAPFSQIEDKYFQELSNRAKGHGLKSWDSRTMLFGYGDGGTKEEYDFLRSDPVAREIYAKINKEKEEYAKANEGVINQRTQEYSRSGSLGGVDTLLASAGVKIPTGFTITRDNNGMFSMVPKTEENDPDKIAERRLQEDLAKNKGELDQEYNKAKQLIMSRYAIQAGAGAGELTYQGKVALADLMEKKSKQEKELETAVKRKMEDYQISALKEAQALLEKKEKTKEQSATDQLSQATANATLNKANEFMGKVNPATGMNYSSGEAIALAKQYFQDFADKPKERKAFDQFQEYIQTGQLNEKGTNLMDLAVKASGNDLETARDVLKKHGTPASEIEKQVKDYQINVLGYPKDVVNEAEDTRKTKEMINTVLAGNGDKTGLSILSASKALESQDPSGILHKSFLNEVISNPNTSLVEKTIAQGLLRDAKAKVSMEDQFLRGELGTDEAMDYLYRKAQLSTAGKGLAGSGMGISGESIDTAALEYAQGNISSSDLKNVYGEEGASQVFKRFLELRSVEQSKGKVLSPEAENKMNEQIFNNPSYKALDRAEPTLTALTEFERQFKKYGMEAFKTGNISPQYNTLILQAKELFNLGVLNGPDEKILRGIIPDPTGPIDFLTTTTSTVENGIQNMKKLISEHVNGRMEDLDIMYGELGDLRGLKAARNKTERTNELLTGVQSKYRTLDGFTTEEQELVNQMSPEQRKAFDEILKKKDNGIIEGEIQSVYGNPIKVAPDMNEAINKAQSMIDVPIKIADSYRSTETQRRAYESGKKGVAEPGKSFHEKGEAIDLAQVPEMKNEKVFSALKMAGLQQHPGEWWHWSKGEFSKS